MTSPSPSASSAPLPVPETASSFRVAAVSGMRADHLAALAGCARELTFEPGQVLFREGGVADTLYLIRSGTVALEMFVPARGSISIDTVGAGDLVGWSWLFPPYRLQFDARALTAVTAGAVDAACLRTRMAQDPELAADLLFHLAQVLAGRLSATRMRLLDVYRNPAER